MGLLNTFIKDKELDYDFKPPKKLTVNTPPQDDDEEFYFAIDDKKTEKKLTEKTWTELIN